MRAGATLLYDSDPDEEEAETRLKASAFLDALSRPRGESLPSTEQLVTPGATSTRVLLVDHEVRTHVLPIDFSTVSLLITKLPAGFVRAHSRQLHAADRSDCSHTARRLL